MRILYVTESYLPTINGAAVFTHNLACAMQRRGHAVFILTLADGLCYREEEKDGIKIFRLPSLPTFLHRQRIGPFNYSRIDRLTKQTRPDIIHVQNHFFVGGAAIKAAEKHKIPILSTNHLGPGDITSFLPFPQFVQRLFDGWMWKMLAHKFSDSDYLTAPSQYAFSRFKKMGVGVPGEVVSNGVDLNVYRPNDAQALRKKYNLPDKPIVLYVGRIDQGKRMEVWIKAAPLVLERKDAHFVLVGPGTLTRKLKKMADRLGVKERATFIDAVPYEQTPAFYNLASVFAIASTMESQGLVVLEAMASGLPIVAANSAALPELVSHGENGFLFEAGDSRMMAEMILKIIGDRELAKRMGDRSLKLARQHDINRMFGVFEGIYRRMTGPKDQIAI